MYTEYTHSTPLSVSLYSYSKIVGFIVQRILFLFFFFLATLISFECCYWKDCYNIVIHMDRKWYIWLLLNLQLHCRLSVRFTLYFASQYIREVDFEYLIWIPKWMFSILILTGSDSTSTQLPYTYWNWYVNENKETVFQTF